MVPSQELIHPCFTAICFTEPQMLSILYVCMFTVNYWVCEVVDCAIRLREHCTLQVNNHQIAICVLIGKVTESV